MSRSSERNQCSHHHYCCFHSEPKVFDASHVQSTHSEVPQTKYHLLQRLYTSCCHVLWSCVTFSAPPRLHFIRLIMTSHTERLLTRLVLFISGLEFKSLHDYTTGLHMQADGCHQLRAGSCCSVFIDVIKPFVLAVGCREDKTDPRKICRGLTTYFCITFVWHLVNL